MKNISRTLISLLLVFSLVLSMVACGPTKCDEHVDENKDGTCDECGTTIDVPKPDCTHKDANDDGKCDKCSEAYTDGCDNHKDANDDGKCDNGGEDYTDGCDNHKDANDDGKCDNGGENYTDGCDNHKDANDDGKCDNGGEAYSDGCDNHRDANDDGKCDVAGCGKDFTDECDADHKDANDDGKCDFGGEAFEDGCDNHRDANDDYVCDVDGCEEELYDGHDVCFDYDDDGVCDYFEYDEFWTCYPCGKPCDDGCDNHVDANDDGKCDVDGCGEDYDDGCDNMVDAGDDGICDNCGEAMPGTKDNPIFVEFDVDEYWNPTGFTAFVEAGKTVYFTAGVGGMIVTIEGENFVLVVIDSEGNETTVEPVAGVITYEFASAGFIMPVFAITNNGAEDADVVATVSYPVGSMENPDLLEIGNVTVELPEGANEYYYVWLAPVDGKLTITFAGNLLDAAGFDCVVYNFSSYQMLILSEATYNEANNVTVITMDVVADDVLQIAFTTVPDDNWFFAAATVNATIAFTCDGYHVDADDNDRCDKCGTPFADGCDADHRDANDDGLCDIGGELFKDGCDVHVDKNDDLVCDVDGCEEYCDDGCDNHKDEDDDLVCDVDGCEEYCDDGCDVHKDANDDGKCDTEGCDEDYTDGCDVHKDANDDGKCDTEGCDEDYTDGCDTKDCLDTDDDGICNNDGCDKATENKPVVEEPTPDGTSFDSAIELELGVAVAPTITTYNQKNYYKLTATETGAFGIEFWGYYFNIDVYSAGDLETAIKSWNVSYMGSLEDVVDLTEGGVYYIVITSQYEYGYPELTVTAPVVVDPGEGDGEGEDDEIVADGTSFDKAFTLEEGVKVYKDWNYDTTYYKFTASVAGSYGIAFTGGFYGLSIYCEDDLTTAIKSSTTGYSGENSTVDFEAGKVYYFVLVSNYGYDYYLTISAPAAVEPEVPAGSSFETAIELEDGVQVYKDWNYDTTYYKFTASVAGSFSITFTGGFYGFSIYCEDDLTTAIKSSTTGYSGENSTVDFEAGKVYYFVLVSNYGYDFYLTVSAPTATDPELPEVPDCTEHVDTDPADGKCDVCGQDMPEVEEPDEDNGFDSAATLTEGTTVYATITEKDQKLYYKFTASTSGAYSISCLWAYYVQVDIYSADDLDNTMGTWDTGFSGVDTTIELVEGKTYYVVLYSYLYDYGYPELTVTAPVAEEPDEPEVPECTEHVDADPADGKCDVCGEDMPEVEEPETPAGSSYETAIELVPGADSTTYENTADQTFYFVYTATATGNYTFTIKSDWLSPVAKLLSADHAVISTHYNDLGNITATFALVEGETYYITVLMQWYAGSFEISLSAPAVDEPDEPEVEEPTPDGLSFETAYPLEDGVKATGSASSTDTYYKLVVTASGSYRITFNANYYKLYLYNATNTEEGTLVGSTDYLYNAKVYSVDLVEGTYYFLIDPQYSYYGYEITVEKKPDCAAHVDADDNGKCDVCKDDFSDGCDLNDCADVNGDGLCDNANCDEPTENVAAGATLDKAIEMEIGTTKNASIVLAKQKIYFKFIANAANVDFAIEGSYPKYELYSANDTATAISSASSYGSSIKTSFEGLTVGETYYIAISNYYDYAADYTVSLTEYKDPFETAVEIAADGEMKSNSFAAKEKKYFVYTAEATGEYSLHIDPGYDNTNLTIYDAEKNVIVGPVTGTYSSSTYGYVTDVNFELTEGTTYYILVDFTGTWSGTVKITFTAPQA